MCETARPALREPRRRVRFRNFIPFLDTARSVYHYFVTDRLPGVSAKRPA